MVNTSRTPNINRSTLSNTQKILLEKNDAIILANGKTAFGEDFYVYIKANKAAIEQMQRDFSDNKVINFFTYGDVLEFGPGKTPPEDVSERIKEQHGDKSKPWWS